MGNTPDANSCFSRADGDLQLTPADPFYALHYHFGMLLGENDFVTEQAYHRGKMRLHNAWLHREGVIWGLEVQFNAAKGEIRVTRGMALDGSGHELYLEGDACLNIGAWYDKHRDDADFKVTDDGGKLSFGAHVVIAYKACLARQVPALLEPCDGSGQDTAYSRVVETVEILLKPGMSPEPAEPPYHQLRLLFGLDLPRLTGDGAAADQAVLDARRQILARPRAEQAKAWLEAFQRIATLDEIYLSPAQAPEGGEWTLFPALDSKPLVLADISGIVLEKKNNIWVAGGGAVHNERRPVHVATRAVQELLCGELIASSSLPSDAGGPRIDPGKVSFGTKEVAFETDRELHDKSVTKDAFQVSGFDEIKGWQSATITSVSYVNGSKTVTLNLKAELKGKLLRLIAQGTGESPLLGTNLMPLAGSINDPPATDHNGKDFVFMTLGS